MELITILNRCYRFRGFVYQHAHFNADKKGIEVAMRPRRVRPLPWAGKYLDDWCRQVMRSRIEPMKNIARSLRQHRELILNYFRAQKLLSSGVVEGLNNKAKVTMRKFYGFRTFRCLELALYHSLASCPNRNRPTNSSDEPLFFGGGRLLLAHLLEILLDVRL